MDIYTTFKKLYGKISVSQKAAFASTFIVGFLSNLFIFTNKCINHDDLIAELNYNNTFDVSSGRWMWTFLRKIPTYYNIPVVKGLIAMLLLSVTICILISLFEIKNPIFAAVLGAIFATYPINACFFSYLAVSEIYYFAIFFAALSVFIVKLRPAAVFIPISAIIFCCSLGSYQSMLCLTVGIVFIMSFKDIILKGFNFKQWFFKYLPYALSTIAGYLLYIAATKMFLSVYHTSLHTYSGMDKMFSFDFSALKQSIYLSYYHFFNYFFTKNIIQHNFYVLSNIVLACIILSIIIFKIIIFIKERKLSEVALLTVMTLIFPVMINFVYIIVNGKNAPHILTWYSNILFYAFAAALLPAIESEVKYLLYNTLEWTAFLMYIIMIYYGFTVSNQLYQRLYYNTMSVDTMATVIVSGLSAIEDWSVDEPVLFANAEVLFNKNYHPEAPFERELPPLYMDGHRYISMVFT